MVAALFVNSPGGGYVETVVTVATHRFVLLLLPFLAGTRPPVVCSDIRL
jgi:hypothetical protein